MKPRPLELTLLDVPIPPSTNRLYRRVFTKEGKEGRALTLQHARWRKAFGRHLMTVKRPKIEGPWQVEIILPPDCRTDTSNVVKAAEDALVHFEVVPDDRFAEGSFARRGTATLPFGGCTIVVRSLPLQQEKAA